MAQLTIPNNYPKPGHIGYVHLCRCRFAKCDQMFVHAGDFYMFVGGVEDGGWTFRAGEGWACPAHADEAKGFDYHSVIRGTIR